MLSQEAITHAGACSICWMCRHLCPIGYVTGREIHFPRGKATLVSLSARGNDVMDESAQAMYDCLLCNSCANWCETGYQPVKFIREARRELVVRGALPESIAKVVDGTLNNGGCIYGEKHFTGALKEAVDRLPDKARVLLVMGDTIAMRRPEIGLAAMSLMRKAAINFTVLKEEPSPANDLYDLIGELEDVQIYAQAFQKAVHQTGCETVVVLDPYAARILIEDYPRWGCAIQNIRTGTAFFAGLLEKGTLRVRERILQDVTFHDPDRLARDLEDTESPQKIISAMAKTWKELFLHGDNTRSCGNDVVGSYSPGIISLTGRLRMDDALRVGAQILITAAPSDKSILSQVTGEALAVEDIFVLLDQCC